ncbi:CD209 antigen-like protein A [Hippoglossus stenolepis]|uniref:CD209 antigen-like protein A n=1 Tax=Hippoglossus stenolepis TaxID=195615 RepID=UPI001FAFAA63|nr:CD209 antigen-like protein A [Hippoglossus stenolepis]
MGGSKTTCSIKQAIRVTSGAKRVSLVLSVLLAAAVTALGVTLYEITQIKKLQEECEAKHLTEILSKTEPCKVEQTSKPPPVRYEACPRCEDGWEPHGGKCYFFSLFTLTWNQSRTECRSMRGDLVVINNKEEQRFLVSRLSENGQPYDRF